MLVNPADSTYPKFAPDKSFDFEKTQFFCPNSSIGQIQIWVVLADSG